MSEFKPEFDLKKFQENLERNRNINKRFDIDWLKLATRLAVLDIYVPNILENAFTATAMTKLKENRAYM